MNQYILAIDPGNEESGYTLIESRNFVPISKGKVSNDILRKRMIAWRDKDMSVVIEMVASYGMAVGKTVFDTCVWVGRYQELAILLKLDVDLMFRKEVKMNLCGMTKAKDSNISQALKDRFSFDRHLAKGGKGTKKDPGFFFGFAKDIWQAYALGVTWLDLNK